MCVCVCVGGCLFVCVYRHTYIHALYIEMMVRYNFISNVEAPYILWYDVGRRSHHRTF